MVLKTTHMQVQHCTINMIFMDLGAVIQTYFNTTSRANMRSTSQMVVNFLLSSSLVVDYSTNTPLRCTNFSFNLFLSNVIVTDYQSASSLSYQNNNLSGQLSSIEDSHGNICLNVAEISQPVNHGPFLSHFENGLGCPSSMNTAIALSNVSVYDPATCTDQTPVSEEQEAWILLFLIFTVSKLNVLYRSFLDQ